MNDNNSLAHTKWNCKYHIVFAPKYRRKLFYGENRKEIGGILRQLSEWKGVKIVEAEVCPDHIHMLVEIPPKMSVAGYIGFLKGKSILMIFQRHGNLKYKYGNRSFWCRGYYVDTAGKNTKKIACALPGFVDSKNEEKTERNAGHLVVSHSGGGMLRQGTRKGIRRTPANRGMRAHWVVKGLDISEDVCHGMCP